MWLLGRMRSWLLLAAGVGGDVLGRRSRSVGIVDAAAVVSVVAVVMATAAAEQSTVDGSHHYQLSFNEPIQSR